MRGDLAAPGDVVDEELRARHQQRAEHRRRNQLPPRPLLRALLRQHRRREQQLRACGRVPDTSWTGHGQPPPRAADSAPAIVSSLAYSIWCDAVSKRSMLTSTRRKETSVLPAGWGGRAVGESHHRTSRDDSAQRSGMSLKESRADALPATSAASRASHRETAPVRARHCCTSVPLPPANTTGPLPCGARADVGEDEELEQQRRAKVTLRRADQREGGDERKNERRAKLQPVEGLIRRHDFDTTSEDHGTHDLDSQVGHLTRENLAETTRRPAAVPGRRRARRKKSEDKVGGGD